MFNAMLANKAFFFSKRTGSTARAKDSTLLLRSTVERVNFYMLFCRDFLLDRM